MDQATHRLDKVLKNLDRASIVGINYESAMMLFAEVLLVTIISPSRLSRSFEKGHWGFSELLGPMSGLLFDQFARVMVRATIWREETWSKFP